MKYRKFGHLDIQTSILGFGAMRLPTIGHEETNIDRAQAIAMIHYAFDHGVNYIDTAYGYHGGQSEVLVGEALQGGYRQKTYLATKLPVWLAQHSQDFDRLLHEQLERLKTDWIDFYLLHALTRERWYQVRDLGVLEWAEKKIAQGVIRSLGFSFHDHLPAFKEIVDAYHWDFCQIQYNYMDQDYQAGKEGLLYAAPKMAVIVMEPLRGGRLTNPPDPVREILAQAPAPRSYTEWGLLWVWNHKEVTLLLSGMSSLAQVKENIAIAAKAEVGMLTQTELELIERVKEAYLKIKAIDCTECRYCTPCPQGVDIPRNFALYNEGVRYNFNFEAPRWAYHHEMPPEERAENCIQCGTCEEKCPQNLPIMELLRKAKEVLQ